MAQITKQDVLEKLKEEGVTSLDSLAQRAIEKSRKAGGAITTDSFIVHSNVVISG